MFSLNYEEDQYLEILWHLLQNGERREGRNSAVLSDFGASMHFDLRKGFPLLTTKRVFWKGVVEELFWFISGSTNAGVLERKGVNIWREWGDTHTRELGPVYGAQWRSWLGADGETHDQLMNCLELLKRDPFSRRILVNTWNVGQLDEMALPPCHVMFQFYATKHGELDLQLYQRSCDTFLGAPFNIASYALLLTLVAREVGMTPRYFHHVLGDYHLYENHIEQAKLQYSREARPFPNLKIKEGAGDIFNITFDDLELVRYDPHPAIKGDVTA